MKADVLKGKWHKDTNRDTQRELQMDEQRLNIKLCNDRFERGKYPDGQFSQEEEAWFFALDK